MREHVVHSSHRCATVCTLVVSLAISAVLSVAATPLAAAEDPSVSGVLVANGETVKLPYVYVWAEKEGFYDPADPTWTVLFVERPVEPREIGEHIWDAAWVQIGITRTSEFGDQSELQVLSQSLKLSADAPGNISGGEYPEIDLEIESNRVSGRIHHLEARESFDDSYNYDFTFSAPLSDPDAPIGDPLPAGGGDPGAAYLKWVETVHSGDLMALKSIVPPEMADQLDAAGPEEAQQNLDFLQEMTPTDVAILGGSSDGETAILQAEGMMEGEKMPFEVTMQKMGDFWVATEVSM